MNIFNSIKKAALGMPSSNILPMASLMAFTIKDGVLTLMAGSSPYKFKTIQKVDAEDMHMLLPRDVVNFILKLGNIDIDIRPSGKQVLIKYPGGKLKHNVEHGPWLIFDELNEEPTSIDGDLMRDAISAVSKVYSENGHMPNVDGINVSNKGATSWIGGNMGAMHVINDNDEYNFTIPDIKIASLITKTLSCTHVMMCQNRNSVQLKCGDDTIIYAKTTHVYKGHTVFEGAAKAKEVSVVNIDRKSLLSAVSRADIGINVNFDITFGENITVKSDSVEEAVAASGTGEWTMSLNPDYLKKALGVLNEDEIEIVFYHSNRPIMVRDDFAKVIISGRVKQ